jgi:hypothetical protein
LDTFKLGYEFVRDDIGMRREHLKRLAAQGDRQDDHQDDRHDDHVVIVKTAHSA